MDRMTVDRGRSAGVRTRSWVAGKKELYFDPGSPTTTDPTPIVANLEIDESTWAKLEAIHSKQDD
jgi:hypothetical protein